MNDLVINSCMRDFVEVLATFLNSDFGEYFLGCLVAIICFDILLKLLRLNK